MAPAKVGRPSKKAIDNLSKEMKDKIYDLRENQSMSYSEIAKETGLNEFSIGKYCRKYIFPESKRAAFLKNNYTALRKKNPTYTDEEIQKIIKDLLDWAHKGEGISIAGYVYGKYKRDKSFLYDLSNSHPEMEEALETTLKLISAKISNHSFDGTKNATFGEKILPMYCKEYKALKEWQANLAKVDPSEIKFTLADLKAAELNGGILHLLAQQEAKK